MHLPVVITATFHTEFSGVPIQTGKTYFDVLLLEEILFEDSGHTIWFRMKVPIRGFLGVRVYTVLVREDKVSMTLPGGIEPP
jgi:hypothetical protein